MITLTAIERLMYQDFEIQKVLVIAPLRVAKNTWPAEIRKWDHLEDLTWSVIIGTPQERMAALRKKADIYIINRENLQWLVEKSGMPFDYDMVVIDELSSFKNWQAKRFKAMMQVRPFVRRIVGLTGTPSSNGLMDLFAEFRVLDMGQRLGRFIGQYRNAYFKPDRMNGPIVYSYKPLPGAEEQIYRRIGDITISMKACGHLKMPELISTTCEVEMSPDEQEQYDAMKEELVLSLPDGEVTAANAAVLTGKLLQLSNGAIYTDNGNTVQIHDRKLDALEDIIEGMNGKPLLLAYWFKHDYERIAHRLTEINVPFERLDSEASIRRWNEGKIQVGLAHPASTGHGLNLQEGGNTITRMDVSIPAKDVTPAQLKNLIFMLYSRQSIINRVTQSDCLSIPERLITRLQESTFESADILSDLLEDFKVNHGLTGFDFRDGRVTMTFPFDESQPDRWTTYAGLLNRIFDAAMKATRVRPDRVEPDTENEKYLAHVWLQRLGYSGVDSKAERKILLGHLKGYCAFKNGTKMQAHKDKYAAIRRERRLSEQEAAVLEVMTEEATENE